MSPTRSHFLSLCDAGQLGSRLDSAVIAGGAAADFLAVCKRYNRMKGLASAVGTDVPFALADTVDALAPRPPNEATAGTFLVGTMIEEGKSAAVGTF